MARQAGATIKSLRTRQQSRLSLATCEKCGQSHVRDGKPTCVHHTTDENGDEWPCANFPLKGRDICWFHGGRTPTGPASKFWKHGAYSKHLPTRYKHAFELALTDPEITSVKYQLALLDAREAELLKRLDTEESGVLWAQIKAAGAELKRAMEKGKPEVQQAVANALVNRIDTWANSEMQWQELYQIFEMRRKLAETERRREEGLNAHLTLDEMTKIAAFLAGWMRRYVPDNAALRSASAELSQFFGLFQPTPQGSVIDAEVLSDLPAVKAPAMPKQADALNGAVMGMTPLVTTPETKRGAAKSHDRKTRKRPHK